MCNRPRSISMFSLLLTGKKECEPSTQSSKQCHIPIVETWDSDPLLVLLTLCLVLHVLEEENGEDQDYFSAANSIFSVLSLPLLSLATFSQVHCYHHELRKKKWKSNCQGTTTTNVKYLGNVIEMHLGILFL